MNYLQELNKLDVVALMMMLHPVQKNVKVFGLVVDIVERNLPVMMQVVVWINIVLVIIISVAHHQILQGKAVGEEMLLDQ